MKTSFLASLMEAHGYTLVNRPLNWTGREFATGTWYGNEFSKAITRPSDGHVYHLHGQRIEVIVDRVTRMGYTYVHGSYGLGQKVVYSYKEIIVVAYNGDLVILGNAYSDFYNVLWRGHCDKSWDWCEFYTASERSIDRGKVGVNSAMESTRAFVAF